MILISIAISFSYVMLIVFLIRHWEEIPDTSLTSHDTPNVSISVIIVARNEAENILPCLQSILNNNFPKEHFEIILVDDHSDDNTIAFAKGIGNPKIKILSLADFVGTKKINAFKKVAIKYALENAKYDYIIHTDADCIVPENWLQQTAHNFENGIKLQAAPISFNPVRSFLHWFQQLDMYTLMASTNAGIRSQNWYLANGANLAYHKSSLPANIYDESNKFASGDDVYLINQMAKESSRAIYFEPNIIVKTKPVDDLKSFINQRIRWAGKNRNLAKGKMKNILFIPVLANLWVFILLAYIFIDSKTAILSLSFFLLIKWMIDYILLRYMQEKIDSSQSLQGFLLSSLCYPFYIIGIGTVSLFTKSYLWKSRRVN